MSATQVSRFTLCLSIIAYLLLGLSNYNNGPVVCYEANGKVSIENGINGICADKYGDIAEFALHFTEKSAWHCPRCIDLPLSFQKADSNKMRVSSASLPDAELEIATTSGAAPKNFIETLTSNRLPNPPPQQSKTIASLKTVKLLI